MGLRNMYSRFQTCNPNIKRDMLVQKIYMENEYFPILGIFQQQPFSFIISLNISIDRVYNWLSNDVQYMIFPLIPLHSCYIKESARIHAPTTVVNP